MSNHCFLHHHHPPSWCPTEKVVRSPFLLLIRGLPITIIPTIIILLALWLQKCCELLPPLLDCNQCFSSAPEPVVVHLDKALHPRHAPAPSALGLRAMIFSNLRLQQQVLRLHQGNGDSWPCTVAIATLTLAVEDLPSSVVVVGEILPLDDWSSDFISCPVISATKKQRMFRQNSTRARLQYKPVIWRDNYDL